MKENILRSFLNKGCSVTVFPWNVKAEDVEAIFGKRPWLSRSQEIMADETPEVDDAVKQLPEVQKAIEEHEKNTKNQSANEQSSEDQTEEHKANKE